MALKLSLWYRRPSLFFQDIFNLTPSDKQRQFLDDISNLDIDRMLLCSARGTGKTKCLASVALWYPLVLSKHLRMPFKVLVLSGGFEQSRYLYEYCLEAYQRNRWIREEIDGDPLKTRTKFKDGSELRIIAHSETQVLGSHVNLLIVDEAGNVDDNLLKQALPIVETEKYSRVILASTPYDYLSLFVEISESSDRWGFKKYPYWRAEDCNWIDKESIERARNTLDEATFRINYLGEPSPLLGRVFPEKELRECRIRGRPIVSPEPCYLGVDWGFCLDSSTEVLTRDGWKSLKKISRGEEILTFDESTGYLEFQPVQTVQIEPERRVEICSLAKKNIEIRMTPNHKLCLVNEKKEYQFLRPFEIGHHYIPRTGLYRSKRESPFDDKTLRLIGWFIAEGYVEDTSIGKIIIFQTPKSRFYSELRDLITQFSKHWYKDNRFIIYDRRLAKYLKRLGYREERYIPTELKDLSPDKLRLLLDGLLKGNGSEWRWKCKNKVKSKVWRFYTSSQRLADDVQEIALKCGFCAWIKKRPDRNSQYVVDFIIPRKHVRRKDFQYSIEKISLASVEVPNKIILARLNGKPFLIHNMHPTVFTVVQIEGEYVNVLHTEGHSQTKFDDLLKRIAQLLEEYPIKKIFVDRSHIDSNQRLRDIALKKGVYVEEVAFRNEKDHMIGNLRFLVERERLRIPEDFVELLNQMRTYTYDSKRNDDYVDSLMLACRAIRDREISSSPSTWTYISLPRQYNIEE